MSSLEGASLLLFTSPLRGSSIFHTDSLSQPCPASLEATLAGGIFKIANHKRAVVIYCFTPYAGHSKVFQIMAESEQNLLLFLGYADITVLNIKRYGAGLTQGYDSYGGSG